MVRVSTTAPTTTAPPNRARVLRLQSAHTTLLHAARDIVAEHGWQGAQIALIAARAGVATGSVYRHFASKADLFAEVLALVSQREVDVVDAFARGEGPAPDRLRDAVATFMTRALRRRRLAYALIAEPCEPAIDQARLVYRAALVRAFERLVEDGLVRGEFRKVHAATAASCVAGAMMESLVGPLAPDVAPETRTATTLVRNTAALCVAMLAREMA
ncbi:MAG: helix-turn-helix domain-containing protein [Vicinamibacterales bacterium]